MIEKKQADVLTKSVCLFSYEIMFFPEPFPRFLFFRQGGPGF